jgi:hypothetical protein
MVTLVSVGAKDDHPSSMWWDRILDAQAYKERTYLYTLQKQTLLKT